MDFAKKVTSKLYPFDKKKFLKFCGTPTIIIIS